MRPRNEKHVRIPPSSRPVISPSRRSYRAVDRPSHEPQVLSLNVKRPSAHPSGSSRLRVLARAEAAAAPAASLGPPGAFTDIAARAGVTFTGVAQHTPSKYLLETMGSGTAVFDYDNDGLLDIFFVNGAPVVDPAPKGYVPEENRPRRLEPPLPPEKRRHLRGRHRKSRPAGHRLRHGRRRR